MANKNDKGERKSITSRFQIIMLKCRRHAVDFAFRETMPCGFVAPLRDGLTNLCGYFAGLASVQFEISRHLHRQRERGRDVVCRPTSSAHSQHRNQRRRQHGLAAASDGGRPRPGYRLSTS